MGLRNGFMHIDNLLILKNYFLAKHLIKNLKTRKQIDAYHNKKMLRLLKLILPKSAFYSSLYAQLDLANWRTFPIITKNEWMGNFDTVNTVGIYKKDASALAIKSEKTRNFKQLIKGVTVGLSSGTTGNQSVWLVSNKERLAWAGNMLFKMLPHSIFVKEKIAFFMRANSNLYGTLGNSRIQFEFFDMLNDIDQHVKLLNKYQPTILSAPPTVLHLLSKKINSGHLIINPSRVISVADVLTDDNKKFIESAFSVLVHQAYQATEGFIASTCKLGFLHLNEDLLVIQKNYIDNKSGRFEPIITDLSRITQPIIRYKLNDILIEESKPCACGSSFTRIKKIEGRLDAVLYFSSKKKGLVPIFPDFIRTAIISAEGSFDDYLVKQVSATGVVIYLNKSVTSSLKDNLNEVFLRVNCEPPTIVYKTPVPKQSRIDKMRRVINEFKQT